MNHARTVANLDTLCRLASCADWLETTAHQLAPYIETLTGLTPEQRCDFRALTIEMLGQALNLTEPSL